MKYQLKDFNRNIPDKELLEDVKRIAVQLETASISSREYNDNGGKYRARTVAVRFGSWNNALTEAVCNWFINVTFPKKSCLKILNRFG